MFWHVNSVLSCLSCAGEGKREKEKERRNCLRGRKGRKKAEGRERRKRSSGERREQDTRYNRGDKFTAKRLVKN